MKFTHSIMRRARLEVSFLVEVFLLTISIFIAAYAGNVKAEVQSLFVNDRMSVGLNKFDLFMQYLGTASGGDGSAAYRKVTRAMARKALSDARSAGVKYIRVSVVGYAPITSGHRSDLDLWRSKPELFWRQMDKMLDEMDANHIQLIPVLMWNPLQFPAMAGETVGDFIRRPESRSSQFFSSFVAEFVRRYQSRQTILFYELTNELNLQADIDIEQVLGCGQQKTIYCDTASNFSTDELIAFTWRFVRLIKGLDKSRMISSGFATPRFAAENLRYSPAWLNKKESWVPDRREQLAKNLKDIHAAFDIVSVHLYDTKEKSRFGSSDAIDLLIEAKRVADEIGKPLFVGEFGDSNARNADERSFVVRIIKKLSELGIMYSAIWAWEFYQMRPYATHDNRHTAYSLEPGYTDFLIKQLRNANEKSGIFRADNTQPHVVLTWPLECSLVNAPVSLYAVASNAYGSIKKVEFLLDGRVYAVDESPPYHALFSPDGIRPGRHLLEAKGYGNLGGESSYKSIIRIGAPEARCDVSDQ